MATAVLPAMQGLTLDREIMPPSPLSPNASRHGRSRHGGSVVRGGKGRARGYSVVEERAVLIQKALSWVLKRTVDEEEKEDEDDERLVADEDGWVDCEEILAHPTIQPLAVTLPELQDLITNPLSKNRFSIRTSGSSHFLRANNPSSSTRPISPNSDTTTAAVPIPLTLDSPSLPDLVVYETSYANYPLILAAGGIRRAGGQARLQFAAIRISSDDDGAESRTGSSSGNNNEADVSIYIDLRAALTSYPTITWGQLESGAVVTEGDANGIVGKGIWKKVVARRGDIGVLFEDGVVRKEIPVGLRGKGAKGKRGGGGKGKARMEMRELKARSGDEGTGSD